MFCSLDGSLLVQGISKSCMLEHLCTKAQIIVVIFPFKQIDAYISQHNLDPKTGKMNKASNFIGCICALGISIVGNFQETSVLQVHLAGALLAFCIGSLYLWTQVCRGWFINFVKPLGGRGGG